jgi:hypothetical protein
MDSQADKAGVWVQRWFFGTEMKKATSAPILAIRNSHHIHHSADNNPIMAASTLTESVDKEWARSLICL